MNSTDINLKKAAFVLGVGIVTAPIGGMLGYAGAMLFRKWLGKEAKAVRKNRVSYSLDDYNSAVTAYNASVTYFNKVLEEHMEEIPKLKELIQMEDQEQINRTFEEIMRQEF
jgi:gas vesicle protein